MIAKLIGFPNAGRSGDYTGHLNQFILEETQARARARGEYLRAFGAEVFLPGQGIRLNGRAWGGAGFEPRRIDWALLPSDLANMGQTVGQGDITGASGTKARRARAVGAGEDPEVQRARRDQEWLDCADLAGRVESNEGEDRAARAERTSLEQELGDLREQRAAIAAAVLEEQSEGARILRLAGGARFGSPNGQVTIQSSGMAARN